MAEKNIIQVDFDEDVGGVDFTKLNRDAEEDEDVKDNWDDESEDEAPPSAIGATSEASAASKPKKKSAKQIAAEKEALKKQEQEAIRLQLLENAKPKSAEDAAAEKRRLLKAQEDSDFAMGADTFLDPSDGVSSPGVGLIDAFQPNSAESFEEFRKLLTEKIQKFDKSEFYSGFLNSLFQDLSLHLPAEEVRRFGATLTTLAGEKAKHEKEKLKGKGKAPKKKAGIAGAGKKDDAMEDYDHDPVDDFF